MKIMLLIIGPILTVSLVTWAQTYLFTSTKKELDSYSDNKKTSYPKRLLLFFVSTFIATLVLFIVIGVVLYFNASIDKTQLVAFFFSGLVIIGIPFIGLVNIITSYELIEKDRIVVKRWFKSREILFTEIKNYEYRFNQLSVYDLDDNPILFVGDNRLGIDNLVKVLEKNGKFRNN